MAKKDSMLDVFERNKYDLDTAVKKSRGWFDQQVQLLGRQRITPNKVLSGNPDQLVTKIQPGKLYMYMYEPKLKKELPYYDRFPMVFPFRKSKLKIILTYVFDAISELIEYTLLSVSQVSTLYRLNELKLIFVS